MTERQQTGLWFIATGLLLLSLWIFAYAIVNWSIDSGLFFGLHAADFTNEQRYMIGVSGVVSIEMVSLAGVPLVITGAIQYFTGAPTSKKKAKK